MPSYNRIIILGNLGSDPEVREVGENKLATLSVATTAAWSNAQGRQERTTWHRCAVWGKQAELAGEALTKGSPVLVEGSLEAREFTDREGQKQRIHEVRVSNLQLIERRADTQARRSGGGGLGKPGVYETPSARRDGYGQGQEEVGDVPF